MSPGLNANRPLRREPPIRTNLETAVPDACHLLARGLTGHAGILTGGSGSSGPAGGSLVGAPLESGGSSTGTGASGESGTWASQVRSVRQMRRVRCHARMRRVRQVCSRSRLPHYLVMKRVTGRAVCCRGSWLRAWCVRKRRAGDDNGCRGDRRWGRRRKCARGMTRSSPAAGCPAAQERQGCRFASRNEDEPGS